MPIHEYFAKRVDCELKMPRSGEGVPDANGFIWHGEVLSGKSSLREVLHCQAVKPTGPVVAPDDCDPVLRYHLRLDEKSGLVR